MCRPEEPGLRKSARAALCLALFAAVASGPAWAAPQRARDFAARYARPTGLPDGDGATPEQVALGQTLFFDPRLSGPDCLSCASCHNPGFAWGDGLPHAQETNPSLDAMVAKLDGISEYVGLFQAAYPREPIAPGTVARALAAFERTVVPGDAPFDRWLAGDEAAMSDEQKRGFVLFNGKANCVACHDGWRFTDDSFHDIGATSTDPDRGKIVENVPALQFAFKTPTLRNVARRAPYMHVVDIFGGRVRRPSLTPELKRLGLRAAERRALVAFLGTLTSSDPPVAVPPMPR